MFGSFRSYSTITAVGQTSVRDDIRQAIGAAPGTLFVWHVLTDERPFLRVKKKAFLDMKAMASKAAGAKLLKS